MLTASYTLSGKTTLSFEDAVERARQELRTGGFGVLSEIDVQATLKEKLGIDREPYTILGACNPPLAHQALEAEPELGALLPCNVIVYRRDGETHISAVTFTGLAARAGLSYTALEVDADGVADNRADGRFGFTRLLLRLQVETEQAEEARRLAKQAEATCLVSASLDLAVETLIEVAPPASDRTNTRDEVQLPSGRAPGSPETSRTRVPGPSGGRESC